MFKSDDAPWLMAPDDAVAAATCSIGFSMHSLPPEAAAASTRKEAPLNRTQVPLSLDQSERV